MIARVEWHPGELYPRVGFIVTNMNRPAERVVAFYNKRGTCEQWIKEGKGAIFQRLIMKRFNTGPHAGWRLELPEHMQRNAIDVVRQARRDGYRQRTAVIRETAPAVGYALTDDRGHRLGSFRRNIDGLYVAVDRLGRPLGVVASECEAVGLIERGNGIVDRRRRRLQPGDKLRTKPLRSDATVFESRVFGRLTVLYELEPTRYASGPRRAFVVKCKYGSAPFVTLGSRLLAGNYKSCGCKNRDRQRMVMKLGRAALRNQPLLSHS